MDDLTDEQKAQALHATREGILDLITADPALAIRFSAEDLTKVYLAGVMAGVEASGRVFDVIARDFHEEGS